MANQQGHEHQAAAPAPRKLFAECWQRETTHRARVGAALTILQEVLSPGRGLNETQLRAYLAVMDDLTGRQCVEAFAKALETCRYFPAPAVLRELASPSRALPIELFALAEVLDALRKFGPSLAPIPGAVIKDRDADGRCLPVSEWVRAEATVCTLPEVTDEAIGLLGAGDKQAGLDMISRHPALRWSGDKRGLARPTAGFEARDREKLESDWTNAYRRSAEKMGVNRG